MSIQHRIGSLAPNQTQFRTQILDPKSRKTRMIHIFDFLFYIEQPKPQKFSEISKNMYSGEFSYEKKVQFSLNTTVKMILWAFTFCVRSVSSAWIYCWGNFCVGCGFCGFSSHLSEVYLNTKLWPKTLNKFFYCILNSFIWNQGSPDCSPESGLQSN